VRGIGLTKKPVYPPTPGYRVCAGIVGLGGGFAGSREGRGREREKCPRDHRQLSQDVASLSIVLCSTGTILYGKGYGARSNRGDKEAQAHRAGEVGTRLAAGEVMEMVHDGAAQMAEDEPEHRLENFLGCRRHAGRVSQAYLGSRIIVNGPGGTTILLHEEKIRSKPAPLNTTRVRHPKAFGN